MRYSTNEALSVSNTVYVLTNKFKQSGCTINLTGEIPLKGYVVSAYPELEKVFNSYKEFSNLDVLCFLHENRNVLKRKDRYIGAWLDPKDGKIYLDVSVVFRNESNAIKFCKLRNQLAYFDIENCKAVRI
jgi:hypothetical protein